MAMPNVKRIGVLSSSKTLVKMLEEKLCSTKYSISEIKFDESALTNGVAREREKVVEQANNLEIVLSNPYFVAPVVYDINKIKWCMSTWAGVDAIINSLQEGKTPEFQLTRFAGKFGEQLAEYVVSNIINFERGAFEYHKSQQQQNWIAGKNYRTLSELSITILGLGDIGKVVGERCKQFGMKVHAMTTRIPSVKELYVDHYFTSDELGDYLQQSDYLCNILPVTKQTTDILSGDMLQHCTKRKTIFMNIGRGNVVPDDDIAKALRNGWIGGAVLDVFRTEPLPREHELWKLPNVIITPHCSGISMDRHIIEIFLEELDLYEQGKPFKYSVNWKKGY